MSDYTEQEIEMLTRFAEFAYPLNSAAWRHQTIESFVDGSMFDCEPLRAFRGVLPIWREARRQGAEEMREEAARLARDLNDYEHWYVEEKIRAIPLPGDPNASA